MDDSHAEPVVDNLAQDLKVQDPALPNNAASTPVPEAPPSPKLKPGAILKQDSPSLKRRQKQEETSSSVVGSGKVLDAKRVRSANAPVKVLPVRYELCEVEDIVILIANMISELIETNDDLPLRQGVLTRFHSRYRASSRYVYCMC